MNIIQIIIFFNNIFSFFSLESMKPKLCNNCEFFKPEFLGNKFGKCSLFPIKIENNNYLIDGSKKVIVHDHSYCSTARKFEDMCGIEGKKFQEKKKIFFQLFGKDF